MLRMTGGIYERIQHVQGLRGGWYDTSLVENGRIQATKIATSLYDEVGTPSIPIYSSDLKGCVETADIFSRVFNSTIVLDRNLREMSLGDAEGKPKNGKNRTPSQNQLMITD